MDTSGVRNFCIIAHIDAGKSTLADRFLELTGTVEKRKMQEQYLDQMELERERGITIKLQPVRMTYRSKMQNVNIKMQNDNAKFKNNPPSADTEIFNFDFYILNLIDTPGHVDFSYEVSRSLAAVEGAILLVDATKGIQAQTLANLHLAQKQGLTIIPAVNKIDLPNARTAQVKEELAHLLEIEPTEVFEVSGKTGANVERLLQAVIDKVPPPSLAKVSYGGQSPPEVREGEQETKALIFDSAFDAYKGVIAYVRVFSGGFKRGDKVAAFASKAKFDVLEVGFFSPKLTPSSELTTGDIGYVATGLKDPGLVRVGDTLTNADVRRTDAEPRGKIQSGQHQSAESASGLRESAGSGFQPLPGYKEPKPMVFASFFPENADDHDLLKDALGKLKLTDASLTYEPESSAGLGSPRGTRAQPGLGSPRGTRAQPGLGRGFRLGFLGMLHVEIISERLKREFGLNLIVSTPSVEYLVKLKNGQEEKIRSASQLPDPSKVENIAEPMVGLEIITPSSYLGSVMELVSSFRNTYKATDYLGKETAILKYEMPLSEVITDFYDKLKSASSGYASMSYELKGVAVNELVRLDILIAGDLVEPFSRIVPKERAYHEGRAMAAKLKEVVPSQWFEVAIQAAIGGKIIARESIKARRKDVTGYLYGGDVTRKMKLLEKQKKGKKKMKEIGRINLPQEVFLKMLKR